MKSKLVTKPPNWRYHPHSNAYFKSAADLRVEIEKSKELHEHAMVYSRAAKLYILLRDWSLCLQAELEKQHQHNISQQKVSG